jgi:hypothetical protein
MTAITPVHASGRKTVDFISALETLAEFDGDLPNEVQNNYDLRKRLLVSLGKLVTELETPTETAQRTLYNVSKPTTNLI